MANQIIIVGFMGCGKTTVARVLASRLGCRVVDLDELVAERCRRTPAEIIQQDGELEFREIETVLLREVLSNAGARVVALGGGAWIIPENRKLISKNESRAVWLDAPFDLCWKRIETEAEQRPLAPTRQVAQELYDRRIPIYELADVRISITENDSADEIALKIVNELSQPPAGQGFRQEIVSHD